MLEMANSSGTSPASCILLNKIRVISYHRDLQTGHILQSQDSKSREFLQNTLGFTDSSTFCDRNPHNCIPVNSTQHGFTALWSYNKFSAFSQDICQMMLFSDEENPTSQLQWYKWFEKLFLVQMLKKCRVAHHSEISFQGMHSFFNQLLYKPQQEQKTTRLPVNPYNHKMQPTPFWTFIKEVFT